MKTLGIYTKNFSLYHDLLEVLKRRKIPYVSLSSINNIPRRIGAILTSHNELHDLKSQKGLAADVYDSIDHAVDIALQMLIGKELYSNVFIGVDPGEKPGVAVVGDDILLKKTHVESPEDVVKIVKRFLREYPAIECLIRVGHGSIITRNRIINSLIPLEVPIEIVDESRTTSSQQTKRSERDSKAAASIALLKGGKVQRRQPLKPTRGDIRKVQEQSRNITEGMLSISEETALDVLKGNIKLKEAIENEKTRKKPKRL
ncbi:MAG: hypothetical protein KAW47_00660 [Thermoplasmatales archaeon]|nr:hypothetical protein [Thermoplasmatales archaeon]